MKNTLYLSSALALIFACGSVSENQNGDQAPSEKVEARENKKRPEAPNLVSITKYKTYPLDSTGSILSKEIYNENGLKTEDISYNYYGSGAENGRNKYEYDADGNVTKIEELDSQKTVNTYTYENGKRKTAAWSRPNGQGASEEYFYDEQGNKIEAKIFDADGKYDFSRVWEIKYDADGNTIEEKKWEKYSDGTADMLMYHFAFKYDDLGNVLEKADYRENGTEASKSIMKYDAANNEIEKTNYHNGEIEGREVTEYNEYGEAVKSQMFMGDVLNYTNTYEYDEYGNQVSMNYQHEDGESWGNRTVYEYAAE